MNHKKLKKLFESETLVFGHVYTHEGYERYYFEGNAEGIASFIMRHRKAQKIVITTRLDQLILNTIGYFIDQCPDKVLLEQVKNVLLPMQYGSIKPKKISWATENEMEAYYDQLDEQEAQYGRSDDEDDVIF